MLPCGLSSLFNTKEIKMRILTIILLSFLASTLFGQTFIIESESDVEKYTGGAWISVTKDADPEEEIEFYNLISELIEKKLTSEVDETGILLDLKQGKDFDFISDNYKPTEIRDFAESKGLESKGNPDDVLTGIFEWFKKQ